MYRIVKNAFLIMIISLGLFSCQTVIDALGNIEIGAAKEGPMEREIKKPVEEYKPIKNIDVLPLNIRMENDGWNVEEIDTARNLNYLTEHEMDVFLATNALRSNPKLFAEIYVKEIMSYYNGNILQYPNEVMIQTNEGIKPVQDLITTLIKQKPLGIIYPSKGISMAAADHAKEQSITGKTGHNGEDGSDPFIRMNRYGKWEKTAGENISYGMNDGLRIVLQLAIDDGVSSRGHRKNLLNSDFKISGVGIDLHKEYGYSCTIDYAGGYVEK